MRNIIASNMDLDDHNSSFDSEAEDLEVRMYSELYFEPNPDYVPLQTNVLQNSVVRQQNGSKFKSPDGAWSDSRDVLSSNEPVAPVAASNGSPNSNYMTRKQSSAKVNGLADNHKTNLEQAQIIPICKVRHGEKKNSQFKAGSKRQERVRRISNSSSIQSISGSMVLDRLYCCSNSPIPEENKDQEDERGIKVTNWIQSNKFVSAKSFHCKAKPVAGSQGCQQLEEITDTIVLNDSSKESNFQSGSYNLASNIISEPNNNSVLTTIDHNKVKSKAQSNNVDGSVAFKHEALNHSAKKHSTLLDAIKKLKTNSSTSIKKGKCERPGTRKKMNRKKTNRSPTEFTVGLSDESDLEITQFRNNSTLLTNLSINHSGSLKNSAVERVYGITPGEEKQELRPQKKWCKKIRTFWPTDYTADKPLTDRVAPLPHWTPHMTAFYETDFSDEFDLEDIHRRMPSSVIEWDLDEDDLPYSVLRRQQNNSKGTPKQRQRYFRSNTRCERCRSFDHTTAECSKLEHCHLCGETGHSSREDCPTNTCLRCGDGIHTFCQKVTLWSKCDLCKQKGHIQDLCPDVWRRFCFTTSGRTPVPPTNTPSSSLPPDRLSCFSCGRPGHLGPDCQHRVPNYVVLSYDVMSFDQPTENLLGKTILKAVESPAWGAMEEDDGSVCHQYGELVTVYTPSRASVHLPPGTAGLVIGKGGVVINTLQRVSGCTLSVANNKGQDELWVSGANIDPVIRAVLFFFLRVETDIDGLDVYSSALETATGHYFYDKTYRKEVAKLRAEFSRQKQQEKEDLQALNKKNAKKLKKSRDDTPNSRRVVPTTNGCEFSDGSVVDITDSSCVSTSDESDDESDVQIIEKNESLTTSRGKLNLSIRREGRPSFTTPSGKNKILKRVAEGIQKFAKKQKVIYGNMGTESEEFCSDTGNDSKSMFIDKILSKNKKVKNNHQKSMEEHLTNSENSDGDSDSSDLDSAMEDYAGNCIMNTDSDTNSSSEDSDDECNASDDSSKDSLEDENDSDSVSKGKYSLVLTDKALSALQHKRLARRKTLFQMLPEGRLSLMATIKGKLAELYNLYVDVKGTLAQLQQDCTEQSRTRSASSLWSLQEGVKLLATYVLGTKRLGHGRSLVKALMQKLASLESSKESRVVGGEREAIANILQEIFEVDESNLKVIVKYALTLVKQKSKGDKRSRRANQQVLESTPKYLKRGRHRAPAWSSGGSSSFRENNRAVSKKTPRSHSFIDRLHYPSTFNSIDEIDLFNSPQFLHKNIGSFTKTPRSKKFKKSKSMNPLAGRLEFHSPLGARTPTAKRGSSKSPRTLKSKSPIGLMSRSPNTSGRSSKNKKKTKSPRMKRSPAPDSRAKTRGKANKGSRTKSKSPRRRK